MAATASSGSRLAPWHRALKELSSPWYTEDRERCLLETEECLLWLSVTSQRGGLVMPRSLGRTWEALRLLTLLARVDFDAWVQEMFTIWPEPMFRGWVEFKLKPVALVRPVRVGLLFGAMGTRDVDKLVCLAAYNGGDVRPSDEYLRCREQLLLLKLDPRLGFEEDGQEWEVPVCIEHDYMTQDPRGITDMLASTVAVVETTQQSSVYDSEDGEATQPNADRPRFTVLETRAATAIAGRITKESFKLLVELAKLGVRVGNMPSLIMVPRVKEHKAVKEQVEGLRYLTAQDGDPDAIRTGLWSIRVCYDQSRDVALGLLSSVAGSKCVRQMEIDLYEEDDSDNEADEYEDDEGRAGDWEWFTYHLFSRFATHNIHTLRLNLSGLKTAEVDAVRDLLPQTNPLASLDGRADESDREGQQLVASRFCVVFPAEVQARLYDPEEFNDMVEDYTFTTPTPQTVRVISKPVEGEGPWWLVVLPGLSFAWVHDNDIHSFVSTSSEDQLAQRPAFPTMILTRLSDESRDASAELLKLVGHGTTRLELYEFLGDEPLDSWCGSVLRACPLLTEFLQFLAPTMSFQPFIDEAAARNSHLRELQLGRVFVEEPHYACTFLKTLCDPLHPLTTHLEQLDLKFIIEQENYPMILEAALQMLEQNRRLQFVNLSFCLPEEMHSQQDAIQQVFASQLEAQIPIRVAPLSLDRKAAFLSVVEARAGGECGVWSRLDSGVMSNIFQLAAVSRDRLFQLGPPSL